MSASSFRASSSAMILNEPFAWVLSNARRNWLEQCASISPAFEFCLPLRPSSQHRFLFLGEQKFLLLFRSFGDPLRVQSLRLPG